MKYKRLSNNINEDFRIYIGRESLFCKAFFHHKATKNERAKINYIWRALLKQYPERQALELETIKQDAKIELECK